MDGGRTGKESRAEKGEKQVKTVVVIVAVIILLFYFALAKAVGYAEQQLEEMQNFSKLRKENCANGN